MTDDSRGIARLIGNVIAAAAGAAVLAKTLNRPVDGTTEGPDALRRRTEEEVAAADVQPLPAITGLKAAVDQFQQRHTVAAIPLAVLKKFGDDEATRLAALVAYYTFFSIFPLLLALVSILGFVLDGRPDLRDDLLNDIGDKLPVIGDNLAGANGISGSVLAIVIGLGTALWAGLGAMDACQEALNKVWDVRHVEYPKLLKKKLRSVMSVVAMGAMLVATGTASQLVSLIPVPGGGKFVLQIMTIIANGLVFLAAFKLLTAVKAPWKAHLPGALIAGAAYTGMQVIGTWYINRTTENSQGTYATFAVVIGLLGFFYLLAQFVILGSEVNVVLHRRLWPRSMFPGRLTDADRVALADAARTQERRTDQVVLVRFADPKV